MDKTAEILIVEDSTTQAMQLEHLLEQSGLRVACVESAEAAMEQLNRKLPDLIITDYHMPGMTGDELCRKIRMNVKARGVPILMLTSDTGEQAERYGLESGADDYVSKSEDSAILLMRIEALLRRTRHARGLSGAVEARFVKAKLLVVEDSETYRQLLVRELESEGYDVRAVGSGKEALESVAVEAVDAVVLDLVLPDMGGDEVCRSLGEPHSARGRSFGVLVLTGRETREDVARALSAGADDVVGKSRDFALVKARLRALLRRKFLREGDQRLAAEFRRQEIEILKARAEKEAAVARAALAEKLEQTHRELEAAYRELSQAQAQLVQSAKMASLGQLVAGIAHEINNPLAFVMNHQLTVARALDAVADETAPMLPVEAVRKLDKARARLGDMQAGMERIRDLVVKLRTFSRLDEGERKYVKLEESIESVITLLQYRLGHRIRLTRKYGDVSAISCYPGPLNQVIMNVLSNAIDAIEGEGEITIRTGLEDRVCFIAVADTGCGMPESVRERIFEPFFTTKPVGAGTGLGLSISYGIVQKHQGTLEVRSEPGKGTEIVIRIPVQAVEDGDADVSPRRATTGGESQ